MATPLDFTSSVAAPEKLARVHGTGAEYVSSDQEVK
jgi:hypothetical protein